ncbi:MAG: nucleotidyltransferase family protein [Bacteroidota bacterium]
MKAIIFAAGLGTRLQELSKNTPKALVNVNGETLLHHTILHLAKHDFKDIIINIHHYADQIINFIKEKDYKGLNISFSDERDELLDTGGGLVKAKDFFNEGDFLAYNVDILSNINLTELYNKHTESKALATLAVRNRNSSRYFLFDKTMNLSGWENTAANKKIITKENQKLSQFAFSGIQIISPNIFDKISHSGVFSMTNVYIDLAKKNIIKGYIHNEDYWFDTGTPEKLAEASKFLQTL